LPPAIRSIPVTRTKRWLLPRPWQTLPVLTPLPRLVRIIDGDTFEVDGETIRLAGIDTPEVAPRAKCLAEARLAEASKAALAQVMMTSWGVRPSLERQGQDRYGRTLAVARMANGTDVGAEMVRLGYAERWPGRRVEWCGPYA
jgi:micrococcal nuclease